MTISEQILSRASGQTARAGEIVVCHVDRVIGTDASSPMAIDYFRQMGGTQLFDPSRVTFSLDHYSPPSTERTRAFHEDVRTFAAAHGAQVTGVGEGISHQIAVERADVLPGDLVIGADSHTVTCGALNLFATGVGSSDLAAAMITGRIWLRVPETIAIRLEGARTLGVSAKDIALALVAELGSEGADYHAIEYSGSALAAFSFEERLVFTNLAVEMGAKAAMFPFDEIAADYLRGRSSSCGRPVVATPDARYSRTVVLDVSTIGPRVALPDSPDRVVPIEQAAGTRIDMVFIGTCTGGRVSDIHEAMAVLDAAGGHIAPGVQLVITPASREVEERLTADGTLPRLASMGAIVTTVGCGACCGTSGVIPTDGMNVASTANRNFKARMGCATASIYLASPAACAAAAVTGQLVDPRTMEPRS